MATINCGWSVDGTVAANSKFNKYCGVLHFGYLIAANNTGRIDDAAQQLSHFLRITKKIRIAALASRAQYAGPRHP
jgi:hypothetical protein